MFRFALTLLLLFIGLSPTAAQAEAVEVPLGGGYSVVLPDGWEIPEADVSPVFEIDAAFSPVLLVHSDGIYAQLMSPASLTSIFEDADADIPLEDALLVSMATLYNQDLTGLGAKAVGVEFADLTTYEGTFFQSLTQIDGTAFSRRHYLVKVDESGSYLAADVYAEGRTTVPDSEAVIHALLDSVVAPGASGSQASGEPCFVSTQTARTATVRVGPGENRTALFFLAVDKQVPVTGRIVLDDDTVWYQLDKAVADPSSDAAELWVAQSLVDEVGDCALVGETAAPPIRPIMSAPPATGGNNNGGGGGGSAPAGSLPQSGTWTMTLGSRGLVSCLGTNTIEFNTSQVYGSDLSDVYSLTSNPSTDSFVMGGQAFTRLPSGAFTGALSFNNGSVGINFYVQNTGFMSGELVYNETVQGLQCSFTIPLSASRN